MFIIDPGNHWHKDDMPDEEPIPGVTEPNYDEHAGAEEIELYCDNCPGSSCVDCCLRGGDEYIPF